MSRTTERRVKTLEEKANPSRGERVFVCYEHPDGTVTGADITQAGADDLVVRVCFVAPKGGTHERKDQAQG